MRSFNAEEFGRVGVLMGGWSPEREVSLMSGEAVLQALQNSGIDAVKVDVDRDIVDRLKEGKFDRVFNILHGPGGEDGVIQGILELLQIPYTGSQVGASALTMNKIQTKRVWQSLNFPVTPMFILNKTTTLKEVMQEVGLPCAIKPANQGSTIGLSCVRQPEQFEEAKKLAFEYASQVIAEPWIEGKELTVGILGDKTLPVIHIEAPRGFYNYEAKYFSDETQYHCPSGLEPQLEENIRNLCYKAFLATECRHWGRVDLILDRQNRPWLLEVNTAPGMTSHSLVPQAAKVIGIDFNSLVVQILAMTLTERHG